MSVFKKLKDFWQIYKQLRQVRRGQISEADAAHSIVTPDTPVSSGPAKGSGGNIEGLSEASIAALISPDLDKLYPDGFELTDDHVTVIRRMRLSWNGTEGGAPQQDPDRPFLDAGTLELLGQLANVGAAQTDKVDFLVQRRAALSQFCQQAQLTPGQFHISNISFGDVSDALGWLEDWETIIGVGPDMAFDMTRDDIVLAKAAQWDWPDEDDMAEALDAGEIAGPTVDPKRPYGDMSYFELDIHRVLGWPIEKRNDDGFIAITDAQAGRALNLHFRQLCAMQVLLEHGRLDT